MVTALEINTSMSLRRQGFGGGLIFLLIICHDLYCHFLKFPFVILSPSIYVKRPYTKTSDERGSRTFTMGIIKPIYLATVRVASIVHVVPRIYHNRHNYNQRSNERGSHHSHQYRLLAIDDDDFNFTVVIDAHLRIITSHKTDDSGEIIFFLPFLDNVTNGTDKIDDDDVINNNNSNTRKTIPVPTTVSTTATEASNGNNSSIVGITTVVVVSANFTVPRRSVELWWPNGSGSQPLYDIMVAYRRLRKNNVKYVNTHIAEKRRQETKMKTVWSGWIKKRIGECIFLLKRCVQD